MDRTHIRALHARFDASLPIEKAWTPPASWFSSTEFHEFEQAKVFTKSWQPAARIDELPEPGSFLTGCSGRNPWVIVRANDGQLRAFHNTCRHKGREVVQGSGCASELVCGYHAWTYDLEGQLRSAPRMAGIADFDRKAMSLPPVALETWGPWVFVNGDPDCAPLSRSVAPLTDRLDASGWDRLRFASRTTWQIECNWKVVVDNYLDGGYHIPHMHPTLDAQLDMKSYRTELFEECSIQSSRSADVQDDRIAFDAGGRIGDEALYLWLFPNFMINRYGPCMDTNHVIPRGPDRCEVIYDFFFMDDDGPDARRFIEESVAQSAVTQREDIAICESVQLGLRSTSYDRGRYAPRVEMGEHHFHRLLAARLGAELAT